MQQCFKMTKQEGYLSELNQLIESYGIDKVADMLGKSSRGVSNWIAANPKIPHEKTRMKISEIFRNHQNGSVRPQEAQHAHDYRDEVITLLKEKISLNEARMLQLLQRNHAMLKGVIEILPILVAKVEKKITPEEAAAEMRNKIEHHLDVLKKESI